MYERIHDFTSPIRLPNNLAQLVAVKMTEIQDRFPPPAYVGQEATYEDLPMDELPQEMQAVIAEYYHYYTRSNELDKQIRDAGLILVNKTKVMTKLPQDVIDARKREREEKEKERQRQREIALRGLYQLATKLARVQVQAIRTKIPTELLTELDAL